MKRFIYILSIALIGVVACNKLSVVPEPREADNAPADGAKMEIRFSLGEEDLLTRGKMTADPYITPDSLLYVFVYNANSGVLLEVAKATLADSVTENTPWTATTENDIHHADFSALVTMGSAPRYLHFVVDPPTYVPDGSDESETGIGFKDNPIFTGETESNVAAKLYNTGGQTSYWQRVHLPNGLTAYTYPGGEPKYGTAGTDWTYTADSTPGDLTDDKYIDVNNNTVYYGDYVNAFGHKITDGTGYICSTEVRTLLRHIPMVRNFVNIRVSKAEGGTFTPSKAVLLNTPVSGFIAPYSAPSGFVSYYVFKDKLQYLKPVANPQEGILYGTEGVISTGYTAPVPNDEIFTDCPDEEDDCVSAVDGVIDLFMYERGVPEADPTQLLVYGNLSGVGNTWLKIDITDLNGDYTPFFREFTYEMKIGAITGTKGYSTMKGAYDGPSIGNPSASPETATLTTVTDGKGVGIEVQYIDYASFDPSNNPSTTLRYRFWNASGSLTSTAKLKVTHKTSTGAITSTNLSGTPDPDNEGWYIVTVPLQPQGQTTYKSVLRVSGTATNTANNRVTLFRDVTFSVMPTQKFAEVKMSAFPNNNTQTTKATITLPDGLGYSLFPLVIRIEAYNQTLNPTDADLPVQSGVSTFSVLASTDASYKTDNSFWFNKTIDFEDYDSGTRTFEANFKGIKARGSNGTVVLFSDAKGHFEPVKVTLAN